MVACATFVGRVVPGVVALCLAMPVVARGADHPGVIWLDRGTPAATDDPGAPLAPAQEPGTAFRFVKESLAGTSAKF